MNQKEAFQGAICQEPDKDDVRLIYADFLDERDESVRAEFIRLQIQVARLEAADEVAGQKGYREDLLKRVNKLWNEEGADGDWVIKDLLPTSSADGAGVHWLHWLDQEAGLPQTSNVACYRRGFVECVQASWDVLDQHLPWLLERHPLTRLVVMDKAPAPIPGYPPAWAWWRATTGAPPTNSVAEPVHALLTGHPTHPSAKTYATAPEAQVDLSRALLAYHRQRLKRHGPTSSA